MDLKRIAAGAVLLAGLFAVAAHAQWSGAGWGVGHGGGSELGRTEGPITVDVFPGTGASTLAITVSGCGGVRDYRSFGTDVVDGEGQVRDASAALTRLLGEARRVCGFEERLAARVVDGFEPALTAWLEDYAAMMAEMNASADMNMTDMNMTDMNMTTDWNSAVDCTGEEVCNGI